VEDRSHNLKNNRRIETLGLFATLALPVDLAAAAIKPLSVKRIAANSVDFRFPRETRCCIFIYMAGNTLWAPWRAAFILGKREKGCIFCNRLKMKDSVKNLIMYRGESCFIILNKFPYNTGHTLIVPYRHISQLEKLKPAEAVEFFELTRKTVTAIKKTLKPHALNVGMNLGRMSGAGIPAHLHMHIVPRWNGDTNFLPVIGKTSVISIPLEPAYELIRKELAKL